MKKILLIILFCISACGGLSESDTKAIIDILIDEKEATEATPTPTATPTPNLELDLNEPKEDDEIKPELTPSLDSEQNNAKYIPDNCAKPPKKISPNDGWKCMPSATQGGSIVCLLPYQFTWPPYREFTDHHNVTMKCNKNDERFDSVSLILKSGKSIDLAWDKCQNYVATQTGKIGRQHWRQKSIKWVTVKDKVDLIVMSKGKQQTCLKF